MNEHFILTADDVRAIGFDPDRLEAATVKRGKAIRPMRLAGVYAGKFALPVTVARIVGMATGDALATLPTAQLTAENFKWFADAQQAEPMEIWTNERTR